MLQPMTMAVNPNYTGGINPDELGWKTVNHTGFNAGFGLPWLEDGFDFEQAKALIEEKVPADADFAWLDIEYPLPYLYETGWQHAEIDRMLGRLLLVAGQIRPRTQWSIYGFPTNRGYMSKMGVDWMLGQLGAKYVNRYLDWYCPNCYIPKIGADYSAHFYAVQFAEQLSGPRDVYPAIWHRCHNGGWSNNTGFKLHDPDGWREFLSQLIEPIDSGGLLWWGFSAEWYYKTRCVMAALDDPTRWRFDHPMWDRIRLRGVEEGWLPADVSPGYVIPNDVLDQSYRDIWDTYAPVIAGVLAQRDDIDRPTVSP